MAKEKRNQVLGYVRKSRLKDSKGMEIDRQIELLEDYAEQHKLDVKIYAEQSSSEDWEGRPQLQAMLIELQIGIYDGVLVTDQDRIVRDNFDFLKFIKILANNGLLLYILNKVYNPLDDGDAFFLGLQGEMDTRLMKITKRKLKRGRIQAINKGVYFGIAPYGYTKDTDKHLLPLENEAQVVKDVFDMYVNQGLNQAEICEQLTLKGKKSRKGKAFTPRATSLILSNVAYKGIVHYEMEGEPVMHVEEAHPALVDENTWDKAQQIRKVKRKVPQQSQRGIYTLSRLLICLECKQTLSFCMKYNNRKGRAKLDKDSRDLYILNCYSSKGQRARTEWNESGKTRCKNNGVRANRIEEALFAKLKENLKDINDRINAVVSGEIDVISVVEKKQQELTIQHIKLDEEKKRVQDGYKAGIYEAEEAIAEIKRIKEQQKAIQQELKSMEGADVKEVVDKLQEQKNKIQYLLSMDIKANPAKTNKLLHEIIDKVYYWKELTDNGGETDFVIIPVYHGESGTDDLYNNKIQDEAKKQEYLT